MKTETKNLAFKHRRNTTLASYPEELKAPVIDYGKKLYFVATSLERLMAFIPIESVYTNYGWMTLIKMPTPRGYELVATDSIKYFESPEEYRNSVEYKVFGYEDDSISKYVPKETAENITVIQERRIALPAYYARTGNVDAVTTNRSFEIWQDSAGVHFDIQNSYDGAMLFETEHDALMSAKIDIVEDFDDKEK